MTIRDAMAWGLALTLLSATSAAVRADDKPTTPPSGSPANIDIESLMRSRAGGGPGSPGSNDPKKYRDFLDVTAGAQKHDGLFTLYQKDEHLYAEIKPFQFDQPMLALAAIARGLARAGEPLSAGEEEAVIVFHRAGDKVQVIRRNVHYKAPLGSPTEKAVKQNYTDSIIMALPIVSLNPGGGMSVVIDLADIYFTDFAQVGLGFVDRSRTNWFKVNAKPNNLELQVQATFAGGMGRGGFHGMGGGDDGVADRRGVTLVIHYSLVKLNNDGYRPRVADDRLGHFLNAAKDFGQNDPDTNIVRYINRWRLEKADPRSKLSPPKKQIIWYIEDTVPVEYRPFVEDGIREWNKAFEKIGFREALAVRWQEPGRDEFDPEDINYCTFRWITTNNTFAMSCLRSNPITGEMIDGDVIFDASFIKYWKTQYAMLTGSGTPPAVGQDAFSPFAVGEVISPILADKEGFGRIDAAATAGKSVAAVPAEWTNLQMQLMGRLGTGRFASCRLGTGMQAELGLAALAMADAPKDKADPEAKLPEEFLGQMIKEVVMHEVGHSLGLRHNFKASAMLDADQLNDPAITRVKGQSGSVMDYNPINIAPKGQKQGDYVTTTLGPYDYWAIEYAYKDFMGDETGELKKVASRAPEHDLAFATDTDRMVNEDPLVNVYDLGSDTCRFAKDRITLTEQLLKELDAKVVKDGESWSRARVAFGLLMSQYGNAATLVASYVGGQSIHRDHKGDKDAHDPIVPVSGDKQRSALAFLAEHILGDKSFKFSPALLRRLSGDHWDQGFGASGFRSDASINDRVLAIQKIALNRCLASHVLTSLQNQELQADPGTKPLTMAEVFRALTDGVFSELNASKPAISTIRRNLQREYLRRLSSIALGEKRNASLDAFAFILFSGSASGNYPADARSLARLHLREIGDRIGKSLDAKDAAIDDTCRAHLEEARHKIAKVLDAHVGANEP